MDALEQRDAAFPAPLQLEQRGHVRRRTIKGGKIVFNNAQSVIDCWIRDLSEGGARLVMRDAMLLPHEFQLHMLDGRIARCALRWAKNTAVGVQFLD